MKKWTLFLICTVLLVSCSQAVQDPQGWVRFAIPKDLHSDTDSQLTYYEYKSEALFESTNSINGEKDWSRVGSQYGVSDVIGPFSQGYWRFSIHACNRNGSVLYTDSKEVYISEGRTAYIVFNATRGEAEGTVEVDISTPRTTASSGLSAVFNDGIHVVTKTDWTTEISETEIRYTGTLQLIPGSYIALFNVEGAGEAIAVEVLSGETAHITGTLLPSVYAEQDLIIVTPDTSRAHISASSHWMELGETLVLSLIRDYGSYSYQSVDWYINGVKQGSGTEYSFTPVETGVYEIVAFVYERKSDTNVGNTTGNTVYYETSTSSPWTVRVTTALTSVRISRAQIIDITEGNVYNEDDETVSFPYDARVLNVHADGRYTLYELGLHQESTTLPEGGSL